MQISWELSDSTHSQRQGWLKCEVKSLEQMRDSLSEEELIGIDFLEGVRFECHSTVCDNGGPCCLFYSLIQTPL